MAYQSDILQQIQQMQGFGGVSSIEDIFGLDEQSWLDALMGTYGIDDPEFMPGLGEYGYGISKSLLPALYGKASSPMVEQKSKSLYQDLLKTYQEGAPKAFGGFAGSSQADLFTKKAKDVYGEGMTHTLGFASETRSNAWKAFQDAINQQQQLGLDIAGFDVNLGT